MKVILLAVSILSVIATVQSLETVYQWKYIDYVWNSKEQKEKYVKSGEYNHTKIVAIDVDRAKDGRVFVTSIRLEGVPASLSTISNVVDPSSGHLLKPYPDWSWFNKGDCNGITSVFRVMIDECNKMYVLDTGKVGLSYVCPAQLLVFDLATDRLIDRIKIPDNIAQNKSGAGLLITPIVLATGPKCTLKSVYMADTVGKGLVVLDSQRRFARLESNLFEPDKHYSTINVAGDSFYLDDSLFGMALTQPSLERKEKSPQLYLRTLASRALWSAESDALDRTVFGETANFKGLDTFFPSQASAMAMSREGTLFFGLTREIAIGCWNRFQDMNKNNIEVIAQDSTRLQFTGGLKVIPGPRSKSGSEELWVLSNRFQKTATGTRNYKEVNFRIMRGSVDKLIKNTKCRPPTPQFQFRNYFTYDFV